MKYDAFISHSSAQVDLPHQLRRALHRLAKAWFRLRALNVYLDKTNLSATHELGPVIERALASSHYFILLASPAAARSTWVDREVRWWLKHRSIHTVIIVLTDSELRWDDTVNDFLDTGDGGVLPPSMTGVFESEPRYVDLSWARSDSDLSLNNTRFREATLDIAAPIHGVAKEDLDGDDVRQLRRTRTVVVVALSIMAVLAAATTWQSWVADDQRDIAEKKATEAQSRSLTLQSRLMRHNGAQFEDSILLAVEAIRLVPSLDAILELVAGLELLPEPKTRLEHPEPVEVMFTDRKERWLLTVTNCSNVVRMWDTISGDIYDMLERKGRIVSVSATPDFEKIAVVSQRAPFEGPCFDAQGIPRGTGPGPDPGEEITLWKPFSPSEPLSVVANTKGTVVAIHPAGTYLAVSDYTGIKFWKVQDGNIEAEVEYQVGLPNRRRLLKFSPNGKYLAATNGPRILVWGSESASILWQRSIDQILPQQVDSVSDVAFSADEALLAATSDNALHLIHAENGADYRTPILHKGALGVSFSAEPPWLATTSRLDKIRIFDTTTWRSDYIPHPGAGVHAFGSRHNVFATAGSDRTTRVWRLGPNTEQARIPHEASMTAPVFLASGKLIATVVDNDVILWQTHAGVHLAEQSGSYYKASFISDRMVLGWGGANYFVWKGVPWSIMQEGARGLLNHRAALDARITGRDGTWL